jgi:hypothetical protein
MGFCLKRHRKFLMGHKSQGSNKQLRLINALLTNHNNIRIEQLEQKQTDIKFSDRIDREDVLMWPTSEFRHSVCDYPRYILMVPTDITIHCTFSCKMVCGFVGCYDFIQRLLFLK